MRRGLQMACLLVIAAFAAPVADAAVSKRTPEYTQAWTGITGPVAAEGGSGIGEWVWIAETHGGPNTVLHRFEPMGGGQAEVLPRFERTYTDPEGDVGELSDLLFDNSTSLLFLADKTYNRVLWYTRSAAAPPAPPVDYGSVGQTPGPIGATSSGSGNGEFNDIRGMALQSAGTTGRQLLVADAGNARVQVFDVDGSGLTHAFNITLPSWGSAQPIAVAVDDERNEIWVTVVGGTAIEIFDEEGNYIDGFTPNPFTGVYNDIEYNELERVYYTSNQASIDIYSPLTKRRLGTYLFNAFSEPPDEPDDSGSRMIKHFALESSTSEIYVSRFNPNYPGVGGAYDDPAPLQSYQTTIWPTCDVSQPILLDPGESTTITPSCTDDDGSLVKEFTLDGQPSLGNAFERSSYDGFDYTAPPSAGVTNIPFYVTTMNGRSQLYQQPVNIVAPAGPAPSAPAQQPTYRDDSNLSRSTGEILIQLPGTNTFVPLERDAVVPLGTVVDARQGVAVVTWARPDGSTYSASFWAGVFEIAQSTGANPVGEVKLRDDLVAKASTARATTADGIASAPAQFDAWIAKKKKGKRKNKVWGKGKGKFRSSGSNSSATVRGTVWLVENFQNATRTYVRSGIVDVRDFKRRKTIRVRKGKSYEAFRR